ncbi:MAG TPA: CxxC-x17-CxxC domain-containing protein [Candidatus Saccharimonadales bacterium]|jgi:CxxC-x17-CxxC domain-containing protein|nr:CxxC-x17-CxxC domain-containing protein [Candidatus Saccharimonadales bacterium]
MGDFNRDDNRSGGYRGGFGRGGGRGGFSRGGGSSFGRGGDRGDRQMFDATCSNCGKPCQVPFRPTNGKPVYCSDCFEKMGNGGREARRFDDRPRAPQEQGGPDLSAINAKLDKILNILQPKAVTLDVQTPAVKEEKVVVADAKKVGEPKTEKIADKIDLPKIKKAVKKAASTKKK